MPSGQLLKRRIGCGVARMWDWKLLTDLCQAFLKKPIGSVEKARLVFFCNVNGDIPFSGLSAVELEAFGFPIANCFVKSPELPLGELDSPSLKFLLY